MSAERPPIHEKIEVIKYKTIYKTTDNPAKSWWCTVILGRGWGRTRIFIYLHKLDDNGVWKRKQKATIGSVDNWDKIKAAVEEFLPEAFGNR